MDKKDTMTKSPSLTFVLGEFERVANDAIETTLKRSLSALDVRVFKFFSRILKNLYFNEFLIFIIYVDVVAFYISCDSLTTLTLLFNYSKLK